MNGRRVMVAGMFAAGIVALLMVSAITVGFVSIPGAGPRCTDEERAVYDEFPQYADRSVEPDSNEQFGGCFASYFERPPTEAVQVGLLLRVQSYYGERLRERGWTITQEPSPPDRAFAEPEGVRGTGEVPKGEGGDLICARRGEYHYHLLYAVEDAPQTSVYFQTVVDDHALPCGNGR